MVASSFQVNVPGSFTSWQPMCWFGCQQDTNDPTESWNTAIVPASKMSIGGTITVPPAAVTASLVAAASTTVTYTVQNGGMSGVCWGPRPATFFPRRVNIT